MSADAPEYQDEREERAHPGPSHVLQAPDACAASGPKLGCMVPAPGVPIRQSFLRSSFWLCPEEVPAGPSACASMGQEVLWARSSSSVSLLTSSATSNQTLGPSDPPVP